MTSCSCTNDPCSCGEIIVTPQGPIVITVDTPASPTGPSAGDVVIGPGQGGAQGPTGPTGPTGPIGPNIPIAYAHSQGISASVWPVNHDLGFYPNVTVVDSAGFVVEGHLEYVDTNNLTLTFSAQFSGTAYLS